MPRHARFVLPGHLHHVTQRGNHQQKVFMCDSDRRQYLKYLQEDCREQDVAIYAFCLMENHVHLIVKPGCKDALAKTFQKTHQRYAWYFHRRSGQKGHLWEGRFFSCVLEGAHLVQAVRYVERNPVRAQLVARPWDHPWSSAGAHIGRGNQVLPLADIRDFIKTSSWKEYLEQEESAEDLHLIRKATHQCRIAGSNDFIARWEGTAGRPLTTRMSRGRPKEKVTDTFLVGIC